MTTFKTKKYLMFLKLFQFSKRDRSFVVFQQSKEQWLIMMPLRLWRRSSVAYLKKMCLPMIVRICCCDWLTFRSLSCLDSIALLCLAPFCDGMQLLWFCVLRFFVSICALFWSVSLRSQCCDNDKGVRCQALRALRYIMTDSNSIRAMLQLSIDCFIVMCVLSFPSLLSFSHHANSFPQLTSVHWSERIAS